MEAYAKQREHAVDLKLASINMTLTSIPREFTVTEWAQSATKSYMSTAPELDTITTAWSNANSSLTATSKKGSANTKNEGAKALKDIEDVHKKAMNDIAEGRNQVANKIAKTGAYQDIADARKKALTEIANAARNVMVDIQAAAPFPGTALGIPVVHISGMMGQKNSSDAAHILGIVDQENSSDADNHGSGDITGNPPDSPQQHQDSNNNGGVAHSQPNENASSTTPPSNDLPGTEMRNWYADKTIYPRDETKPHCTHQHHYLTPQ